MLTEHEVRLCVFLLDQGAKLCWYILAYTLERTISLCSITEATIDAH